MSASYAAVHNGPNGRVPKHAARRLALATLASSLAIAAVAMATPTASFALSAGYCGRLVDDYFATGDKCFESRTGPHTWNYNRNYYTGGGVIRRMCATIAQNTNTGLNDSSSTIYGSGCGAENDARNSYSLCHSPVSNLYYAFVAQVDYGARHTLNGAAETGRDCSNYQYPYRRTQRARVSSDTSAKLASKMDAFRHASRRAAPPSVAGIIEAEERGAAASGEKKQFNVRGARSVGESNNIYVVPGQDDVCFVLDIGDATVADCGPVDGTLGSLGGAAISSSRGGVTIWGAVPDGASDGRLILASGKSKPVALTGNGFAVEVAAVPSRFEWTDDAGEVHTSSFDGLR